MDALYDRIGRNYGSIRRPDPRLASTIWSALGEARTVVNVGAGAGSYEPPDREVVAVEPSAVMIAQRPPETAPVVQAAAESLPFADRSFDAALAVMTIHHWTDVDAGLRELARVASQRVVVLTFDPDVWAEQWIVRDYLPEVMTLLAPAFPPLARVVGALPGAIAQTVPAPRNCTDRMFATLWGRPEQYLDPAVRAASSAWHQLPEATTSRALEALRRDLASGTWDERHGHLRTAAELDVGFRLVRAELA